MRRLLLLLLALVLLAAPAALAGGPDGPTAMAGSGSSLWVADSAGVVSQIDARTGHVVARTRWRAGYVDLLAADATGAWAGTVQPGSLGRIARGGSIAAPRFGTASEAFAAPIALAQGGGRRWLASGEDGRVWRLRADGAPGRAIRIVAASWLSVELAADARGLWVAYAPDERDSVLVRLDRTGRIALRRRLHGLRVAALASAGGRLLVLAQGHGYGHLLRLALASGAAVAPTIALPGRPVAFAVSGRLAWVSTLAGPHALQRIDLGTGRRVGAPVRAPGRDGRADDLVFAGGSLWADNAYGTVSRLDPLSGRLLGPTLRVPRSDG